MFCFRLSGRASHPSLIRPFLIQENPAKTGTEGEFEIAARAVLQGSRWMGAYRVERCQPDFSVTLPFRDEQFTNDTFETRWEAEEAAYEEALGAIGAAKGRLG